MAVKKKVGRPRTKPLPLKIDLEEDLLATPKIPEEFNTPRTLTELYGVEVKDPNKAQKVEKLLKELAFYKDQLKQLDKEALEIQTARREFEEKNKLLFMNHPNMGHLGRLGKWELNDAQRAIVEAINSGQYKLIVMTGDNQIGKTLMGTMIALAFLRGHWPWEDIKKVGVHLWDTYNFNQDVNIRWIGNGWDEHIARVLIDQGLGKFWPASWPVETEKRPNSRAQDKWTDVTTGNKLHFMSTEQEVTKFAGTQIQVLMFDERFPKAIWDENVARLIATGGLIVVTATLDKEDDLWFFDEILDKELDAEKSKIRIFHYEARAEVNYGHGTVKDQVDEAAALMTKEGRERRLGGANMRKVGRILHFKQENVIPRFKIPPDYPVIALVDIGQSKPHDVLFMAVDPFHRKFFCHELELNGDGKVIGEEIVRTCMEHQLKLVSVGIDPLSKVGQAGSETIFWQLQNYLWEINGVPLLEAPKTKNDKENGIILLNAGFVGKIPNNPEIFVFEDMRKTLIQWKVRYDKNGNPSKENDDQFENAYRAVIMAPSYDQGEATYDNVEFEEERHYY